MKAVTTFSPQGYEQYGKKFLETYVQYWPFELTAYVEEEPSFKDDSIYYESIYDIPGLLKFIKEFKEFCPVPKNFLYDAGKFAHKVFAQLAAFKRYPKEEIFWLDADIVTFAPIDPWMLKGFLKDVCVCYLGRDTYSETGFIGFDTFHPQFPLFKRHYEAMYTKGKIFELPYWTDCHAFDAARRGKAGKDLTQGSGFEHVFCTSPIGAYCDHLKGNRKQVGFSPEHPIAKQIYAANRALQTKTA